MPRSGGRRETRKTAKALANDAAPSTKRRPRKAAAKAADDAVIAAAADPIDNAAIATPVASPPVTAAVDDEVAAEAAPAVPAAAAEATLYHAVSGAVTEAADPPQSTDNAAARPAILVEVGPIADAATEPVQQMIVTPPQAGYQTQGVLQAMQPVLIGNPPRVPASYLAHGFSTTSANPHRVIAPALAPHVETSPVLSEAQMDAIFASVEHFDDYAGRDLSLRVPIGPNQLYYPPYAVQTDVPPVVSQPLSTPAAQEPALSSPQAAKAKSRLKWTEQMEEALLNALVTIVQRGKTADGFKKEHFVAAANAVRPLYRGAATVDWSKAKSKFEDKYRSIWGKWTAHRGNGLSGWTEDETGVPQNSQEVMDRYFEDFPEYAMFRFRPPPCLDQLEILFGDRVATGEHATDPIGVDSDSEDSIDRLFNLDSVSQSPSNRASISKSPSRFTSRSSSRSLAALGFRKQMAERSVANKKKRRGVSTELL